MNEDAKKALVLEARKLALAANRLCVNLAYMGASDEVRLEAGQAYSTLCAVWHGLDKE